MKHIFLFAFASLLFAGCSKKDDEPGVDISSWTRTVYFGTATLEKTGQQVRVMFDPENTPNMLVLITSDIKGALRLPTFTTDPQSYDGIRATHRYYDVIPNWRCYPFTFDFGGKIELNSVGDCYEVRNFDRQERITGQHIDMVIGKGLFSQMVSNGLSNLPIDLTLTVPYDWGTSQE